MGGRRWAVKGDGTMVNLPSVLERLQAGETPLDRETFATLYEETFASVYRYALLLTSDPAQAEDLVADVYLRAWHARDRYRGDGKVLSWLLSMTHNLGVSGNRRRARGEAVRRTMQPDLLSPSPEHELLRAASAEELHAAIRKLTMDHQVVILLRFFEGRSHLEVGEILDRAPTAVRALQYRALKNLRALLDD
jgi:RNA polymerase sigma-70 factor (ECF subfamily)